MIYFDYSKAFDCVPHTSHLGIFCVKCFLVIEVMVNV